MLSNFQWILASGILMSAIAMVGSVTLFLPPARLRQVLLPLVALSAGTLLGGALFHLLPASIEHFGNGLRPFLWVVAGFALFFALEQFLNWHHCHETEYAHRPLTYLVMFADTVHNFVDGLAVAGAFLIDVRTGIGACLAAAAHEIPQELGDFAVLIHGGWRPASALLVNGISALAFLAGGMVAWGSSRYFDVSFLVPFAAGNFIYIAAADLIPEVKSQTTLAHSVLHFASFLTGLALLFAMRVYLE